MKSIIHFFFGIFILGGVYVVTNRLSPMFMDPLHLYFDWELQIPFYEWTILIYYSAYISFIFPLRVLGVEQQRKLIKSISFVSIIGGLIFLFLPTTTGFTRNIEDIKVFKFLYSFLWGADRPYNLMPSFHVAMSYLMIMSVYKDIEKNYLRLLSIVWLALICISIITVHQHHLLDIPTGLLLADMGMRLFYWRNDEC